MIAKAEEVMRFGFLLDSVSAVVHDGPAKDLTLYRHLLFSVVSIGITSYVCLCNIHCNNLFTLRQPARPRSRRLVDGW